MEPVKGSLSDLFCPFSSRRHVARFGVLYSKGRLLFLYPTPFQNRPNRRVSGFMNHVRADRNAFRCSRWLTAGITTLHTARMMHHAPPHQGGSTSGGHMGAIEMIVLAQRSCKIYGAEGGWMMMATFFSSHVWLASSQSPTHRCGNTIKSW